MSGVTLTLKRITQKGLISFEVPEDPVLQEQIRKVLRVCRDKNNDYVSVTMARPFVPRTTGPRSLNHHLNGHIMQICNSTGNDYDTVKTAIKMLAVANMEYPYELIAGQIVPKRERDTSTTECAKLIEAAHVIAAEYGIILEESSDA